MAGPRGPCGQGTSIRIVATSPDHGGGFGGAQFGAVSSALTSALLVSDPKPGWIVGSCVTLLVGSVPLTAGLMRR